MPLKKSDLYASLWDSADTLRGGMDPSQYKDYVLTMLFVKYVSDKYADSDDFAPAIAIPPGASFADMRAMKGKSDIGDRVNKEVIARLVEANESKLKASDFPDFNDPAKLGEGKDMVDRLTSLIAVFEKPELDFASNRAEDDDLLGDAYEYLMRHFASESGKSKGQFYTPAEVSRVMAQVLGIGQDDTTASTTAYDPTCGSGSLLLKVAAEAGAKITLYGQEKDVTTAGLARMNMILHDFPTATIRAGNTLASPKYTVGERLQRFDYVVANPPFSDKKWRSGMPEDLSRDPFQRFGWGAPPNKQGDYAYLLHIVRSMTDTGKAACILPHGVLFRGNAEDTLRRALVDSGILAGIIGLPPNLFYGTGIPACILVLDKGRGTRPGQTPDEERAVYMIDASRGFAKDGPKNKLRERDVHRIVDAYRTRANIPRYARLVPLAEIANARNDYNLNLPRYIDASAPEDRHDLNAHLRGGLPVADVDALAEYWAVLPGLRQALFRDSRWPGYVELATEDVRAAIAEHPEFVGFRQNTQRTFDAWRDGAVPRMEGFGEGDRPKKLIAELSETLLEAFAKTRLIDPYALYQALMSYWAEAMEDDAYLISAEGWQAPAKPQALDKKSRDAVDFKIGRVKYSADFLPSRLLIAHTFATEQAALDALEAEMATQAQAIGSLTEEHAGEDGLLADATTDAGKLTKASVTARRKVARTEDDAEEEIGLLNEALDTFAKEAYAKTQHKQQSEALMKNVLAQYGELTEAEVKSLVVHDKWLATLRDTLRSELDRVSQTLTSRVEELAERYERPLPELEAEAEALMGRVNVHLEKMGVSWV